MEKSKTILINGGFVIEPIEELFGIDPDLRIIASNGQNASAPILCAIEAMSKQDRRIFLIKFICNKVNHSEIRNSLHNASYTLLESGTYQEYTFAIPYSRYKKGNIYCRVSWLDTGAMIEFLNSNNKPKIKGRIYFLPFFCFRISNLIAFCISAVKSTGISAGFFKSFTGRISIVYPFSYLQLLIVSLYSFGEALKGYTIIRITK